MNDWVFDLQRFSEGEAVGETSAPQGAPIAEAGGGAAESPAADSGTTPAVEADASPDVAIRINPYTGQRELVTPTQEEAQTPAETSASNVETQPAPYTAETLLSAMTVGAVDERRIPEGLMPHYAAFRQQQEIAALRAQQQAPQVAQAQETSQEEQVPESEVYRQVQAAAEEKALQDLGMTREELDAAAYSDDADAQKKAAEFRVAVQMNVNAIARRIDEYQHAAAQQQAEAQAVLAEVRPMYEQMVREEPNFEKIDTMMETYYRQLPYEDAVKIEGAIRRFNAGQMTQADIPILKGYYDKTRTAFYALAAGVGTTPQPAPKAAPPAVESAGKVTPAPAENVDWRAMRSMDVRDRSAFMRKYI